MNIFYIFALCLVYFKASVDGSGVPVLLWTNKQNVRYPMLISGTSLSDNDFSNGFLEQIVENGDQNLVVFVQDELSLNDITNNADVFNDNSDGDVFSSVKSIMERYESTHVSSVANPTDALKKLQRKFKGNIHPVENIDEIQHLTLSDDTPNMVIISLPKSVGSDKRMALKQSDGIMGEVTEKFARERRSFSAVFTAYEASKTHEERANVGGRRLLAVQNTTSSNETYTFFKLTNATNSNESCLFFFYSEMIFQVIKSGDQGPSYSNGTIYNFPPLKSDTDGMITGSKCDSQNNTATLTIDYANSSLPVGITKFSMSITVIGSISGYWTIKDWTISFSGKNQSTDNDNTFEETDFQMRNMNNSVYGTLPYSNPSYGFCYYCGDQVVNQFNYTSTAIVELQFKQFQLQLNVFNNVFGPVNDCMGFFSGPIWMTLIFILLALTILSFGTGLLSNIQTMDRFDDPKGKTIQVNTAD